MADFRADHWMGTSEGVLIKENCASYPPLLQVEIHRHGARVDHTTISNSDAHRLADWIKENIPEPPPAPPEWRIDTEGGESRLMVRGLTDITSETCCAWCRVASGSVYEHIALSTVKGVTPELHKEMICALLDAHYAMHKGDS